jgi:Tol biopolymer transport system component
MLTTEQSAWGRRNALSMMCGCAVAIMGVLAGAAVDGRRHTELWQVTQEGGGYVISFASFAPMDTDIFIADADGGNARPIASTPAFEANASFSADGRWIVFSTNRAGSWDVWRARPDGSAPERLVEDPAFDDQAALSPDGRSLAFVSTRSGQADIWIMDIATRRSRNLSNHPAGDFRPAWSPDGQWIAFTTDRDSTHPRLPANDFVVRQSTALYVIRATGGGLRRIPTGEIYAGSPSWSADGKRLAFYSATLEAVRGITGAARRGGITQIEAVDVTTGAREVVTSGPGEKLSPRWRADGLLAYASRGSNAGVETTSGRAGARGDFNAPSWSPDGRRMLFHREVGRDWPPHRPWHSRDASFQLLRTGIFPSWSPPGDRYVSNDQRAGLLHNSIVLFDASGSRQSTVFSHPEKNALAPDWSRANGRIAFALGEFFQNLTGGSAKADIATIRPDGSDLRVLTGGQSNYGFPSWSGDGRFIVYRDATRERSAILVLDVETGTSRTVFEGPAHYNFTTWSPIDDRIAFTADLDDRDSDVYTVRSDGSNLRRLTRSPGHDAHQAWSPDGQWIAFTTARQGFKDESVLNPGNPQAYGEIAVMRADGSDVRVLTDNPFEDGSPAWKPIKAPRGRAVERQR